MNEWVLNSSRATLRAAAASHAAGARRGVETTPGGVRTRPCAPRACQAAATPKGPGATIPAAGPGARAPTWSGAGSRRQPAGRAGGWATSTCIITWEGLDLLGDRCWLLHEESSRVRDWGDSTRHQS